MQMLNPPHPGQFIKTEIIEAYGLSITAAADALEVSRPTLSTLLNGNSDLTEIMALRIEKAFGVKMDTLVRMQTNYNIAQARKQESSLHVRRVAMA
jgi:addiction module HigA family antidote